MSERDYPEGHPKAADYKGELYIPPRAPWSEDFAPGHPARGGANCNVLDSPDGQRAALLEASKVASAAAAADAPTFTSSPQPAGAATDDSKKAEAREYLTSRGYSPEDAGKILAKYGVDEVLADKAAYNKSRGA